LTATVGAPPHSSIIGRAPGSPLSVSQNPYKYRASSRGEMTHDPPGRNARRQSAPILQPIGTTTRAGGSNVLDVAVADREYG
jgi:hypothetical protein